MLLDESFINHQPDPWLEWSMMHVRFRAQLWAVAWAVFAVAVNFLQPCQRWFAGSEKTTTNALLSAAVLAAMMVISKVCELLVDMYFSRDAIPDGLILTANAGQDTHHSITKLIRAHLLYLSLCAAGSIALSIHKV